MLLALGHLVFSFIMNLAYLTGVFVISVAVTKLAIEVLSDLNKK